MYSLYINDSPIIELLVVPIYLIFLIIFRKNKRKFYYDIVFILFCIYILKLLSVTFLPFPLNGKAIESWKIVRKNWPVINITPFNEVYEIISNTYIAGISEVVKQLIFQIGGNILMFAPFGFLLPLLRRSANNVIRMLLISSITSFLIEFIQLSVSLAIGVCFRYADIDDIITNVLGALIGLLIFKLFIKMTKNIFNLDFYSLFEIKHR